MSTARDLFHCRYQIGDKAHRLTYLSDLPKQMGRRVIQVSCDCGTIKKIKSSAFGITKSCGCLLSEMNKSRSTHGMRFSREWQTHQNMKKRCLDPKNNRYKYYGERGIKVCERWKNSFENFYSDMGPCPPGYSLERVDRDKDYCPENCRWADDYEQANNKSNNRILQYMGKSYTMAELCRKTNIPYKTFHARLKSNWSVEKCVETPLRKFKTSASSARSKAE